MLTCTHTHSTCWHENEAVIPQQGSVDGLQLVVAKLPQAEDVVKDGPQVLAVLKALPIKLSCCPIVSVRRPKHRHVGV